MVHGTGSMVHGTQTLDNGICTIIMVRLATLLLSPFSQAAPQPAAQQWHTSLFKTSQYQLSFIIVHSTRLFHFRRRTSQRM